MKPGDLDRILSGENGITPSSGFVSGVMDAVRREASAPAPIPFPWLRALPGLAAGVVAFVAMLFVFVKNASHPASAASMLDRWLPVLAHTLEIARMYGIGWMLLAILASAACVMFSMRLTTGTRRTL